MCEVRCVLGVSVGFEVGVGLLKRCGLNWVCV